MAMEIESKEQFEKEVLEERTLPVLVDFWAAWCGPCRMQSPIVDSLEKQEAGKLKVCKVNVDENGELAEDYGIMSIPTLIVFKGGTATAKSVGLSDIDSLKKMVEM